jgi:hypothetical protein
MKPPPPCGSHTGSHTGEPKKGTQDMKSLRSLDPSVLFKPAEYETTPEQEQRIERQLGAGRRQFVIAMAIWAAVLAFIAISLMLASAAHAAEPGMCFAWVEKNEKLICEVRGPALRIYTPYRIGEDDVGTTSRSQTTIRSSYRSYSR